MSTFDHSTIYKLSSILITASFVSGCGLGLQVPKMNEFYENSTDAAISLNRIESQIDCEIKEAVRNVFYDDMKTAERNQEDISLDWLPKWAATATLTITIDEQSSLNPGVSFNTPMQTANTLFPGAVLPATTVTGTAASFIRNITPSPQSYSLGIGGAASTEANVADSSDIPVSFRQILTGTAWKSYVRKRDAGQDTACSLSSDILIEGNLGLNDWLEERLLPVILGNNPPPKTSVQRHLYFKIITSGSITPTWKLVRISTPSTPFATAGRTRTYDLIVTLGPDPKQTAAVSNATQDARDLHNAALIGAAVSRAIQQPTP